MQVPLRLSAWFCFRQPAGSRPLLPFLPGFPHVLLAAAVVQAFRMFFLPQPAGSRPLLV
jgi:hypothetical protein